MHPVLLDCDTGIDDAVALTYLACLHRQGTINLAAVTTTAGNTTATLKVVDSPTTPSSPSSLSAVSTALIGTAIGLAAGAVMAILLYFLSQKNPQDKVEDPLLIIGRRRSREDA